eukprot:5443876-Prymnesium_polylepis.1
MPATTAATMSRSVQVPSLATARSGGGGTSGGTTPGARGSGGGGGGGGIGLLSTFTQQEG